MSELIRFIHRQILTWQITQLAKSVKKQFDKIAQSLLDNNHVMEDKQKADKDYAEFVEQNKGLRVDQNVELNTDNKRANQLKLATFAFEAVLSFKGIAYLSDHFTGFSLWYFMIPLGMAFAAFAINGSLTLRHFAESYSGRNLGMYLFLVVASYSLILIIPVCNLFEASESYNHTRSAQFTLTLNWILVLITVTFHAALVTMHNVFTLAIRSKEAMKSLAVKESTARNASQKARSYAMSFMQAKNDFAGSAGLFASKFNRLRGINEKEAMNSLTILGNFIVYMINNKVQYHAVLPYLANENGQPVVENRFYAGKQNHIVEAWDHLSTIRFNADAKQQSTENDTQQPSNTLANEAVQQNNTLLSPDYDQTIDSQSNNNDKIL